MIVVDARPTQNEHRHRGIGRYVRGVVEALLDPVVPGVAFLVHGDRPVPDQVLRQRRFRSRRPHALRYHAGWAIDEILLPIAGRRSGWRIFHATDPEAVPDSRLLRTIATVYDLTPLHDRQLWRSLTLDQRMGYHRMLGNIQRAEALVTISESVRRDVAARLDVPIERMVVAHPGIDLEMWSKGQSQPHPERAGLLFVGAPGTNKNVDGLLQALALLTDPPKLTVAGPWPSSHVALLRADAARRGLRVSVEPFVSDARLKHLYRAAAALVVPSKYEGFGLPVLEAMASGCPVIVSDIPPLREVGGEAACIAAVEDAASLSSAISSLLADGDERRRLAELGLRRAQKFSWAVTAATLRDLYLRLL